MDRGLGYFLVLTTTGPGRCDMPRACYSVERLEGEWIVFVSGAGVLSCKTKLVAQKTAKCATALLLQGRQQRSPDERRLARKVPVPTISLAFINKRRRFQME